MSTPRSPQDARRPAARPALVGVLAVLALALLTACTPGAATTPAPRATSVLTAPTATPTDTTASATALPPSTGDAAAAALARRACKGYFKASTEGGLYADRSKGKIHADLVDADKLARKAAATDSLWQALPAGTKAQRFEFSGKRQNNATRIANQTAELRFTEVCGAAFGLNLWGPQLLKSHPKTLPLITEAPDPFPTKAKAIMGLACRAWEGVRDHPAAAIAAAGDGSRYALAASWGDMAATSDPKYQIAADLMHTWMAGSQVPVLNAMPSEQLRSLEDADDWLDEFCESKFNATWGGYES